MIKFFLTVDGGNSLTKYALFDSQEQLVDKVEVDCATLIQKRGLTSENTLCALVNVARPKAELSGFTVLDVRDYFANGKFLKMPVHYSSTLGMDRLILAYLFFDEKSSTALVDSGTFTTVDLVNPDGFQGGHILPGLGLLLESYDFGFNLKALRPKDPAELSLDDMPKNSHDAIASGLMRSYLAPVVSVLENYSFESLQITGGKGDALYKYLKSSSLQRSASIHFNSDLIHLGLLKFLKEAL